MIGLENQCSWWDWENFYRPFEVGWSIKWAKGLLYIKFSKANEGVYWGYLKALKSIGIKTYEFLYNPILSFFFFFCHPYILLNVLHNILTSASMRANLANTTSKIENSLKESTLWHIAIILIWMNKIRTDVKYISTQCHIEDATVDKKYSNVNEEDVKFDE